MFKNKLHATRVWVSFQAYLFAVKMENYKRKPCWNRDLEEEFADKSVYKSISSKLARSAAKRMIATLFVDKDKGPDYGNMNIFGEEFANLILKSGSWIPKRHDSEKAQTLQRDKSYIVLAQMLSQALKKTQNNNLKTSDMFTKTLIKEDDALIINLFARWMHSISVDSKVKIMDSEYKQKDIQKEVALLSEFIFKDREPINPRLTGEALMVISESVRSVAHIESMNSLLDPFDEASEREQETKIKTMTERAINRLDKEINTLAHRTQETIINNGIGNPNALIEHVLEKMAHAMGNVMMNVTNRD